MQKSSKFLIWGSLALVIAATLAAAAASPLLQWREPVYIVAGFAGIIAMLLLFIQPLLIGGYLPDLNPLQSRRLHRWIGASLVFAIIVHVVGLWITSPPDVVDALLFASPTPFSVWGVIAMWAIFATGLLAVFRLKLRLRPKTWRLVHLSLAAIIIAGTIAHALLIEGTMASFSKIALSALLIIVSLKLGHDLWNKRKWTP